MNILHQLAAQAGVAREWTDAAGVRRVVADDDLQAILAALGLDVASKAGMLIALDQIAERNARRPALFTADCNEPVILPSAPLIDEAGAVLPCDPSLSGIPVPGYYRMELPDGILTVAVAPERCRAIDGRRWGVSVQIPSLRGEGDFGDFATLAEAVTALGQAGADAVAISPVHALSLNDPGRFAPYSPSSRLLLNALFGAATVENPDVAADLIDWTRAGPAKLAVLRAQWGAQGGSEAFAAYVEQHGREGLGAVQRAAREAGMAIGLITDLAVGVDPAGSEATASPQFFLQGLRIGAPPDPLGPQGQDWGLTSYSPQALVDSGFAPFVAMLRAGIPQDGGIRIDHAFGLQRLWVIPEGRPAGAGAYLSYPFEDMLRLIKLEAWRKQAVVIAEDLGTRPPGFGEALQAAGIYGMAVLPFARDEQGAFLPADGYPATSVAMSATHDVATVAGWWTGRDLEWNAQLSRGGPSAAERAQDRAALWRVIGDGAAQPADDDPAPVVDAAIAFLARTPCPLTLIPMEDLTGLGEQPNLPGTVDEHPNWRRRLPAPIGALLAKPEVAARIARLNRERGA
jgi:4-alpha-glucanotransferase